MVQNMPYFIAKEWYNIHQTKCKHIATIHKLHLLLSYPAQWRGTLGHATKFSKEPICFAVFKLDNGLQTYKRWDIGEPCFVAKEWNHNYSQKQTDANHSCVPLHFFITQNSEGKLWAMEQNSPNAYMSLFILDNPVN